MSNDTSNVLDLWHIVPSRVNICPRGTNVSRRATRTKGRGTGVDSLLLGLVITTLTAIGMTDAFLRALA